MAADRPRFRPDIEGLRGVAILLVVLFHAGVAALDGGFVGVDVFFVLSGFFITGLLLREQASAGGELDLRGFYGARALRLLPSLLVVLLATLALVTWLYAPIDRAPVAANARWVALHGGNVAFARESVDYFSSGANPLLHTWSLAVEEQFYVVWPLLFLLLAWIAGRRRADARPEGEAAATKRLLLGIGVAGALSFVASLWLTHAAQPWAFFGMPTRIWEFALGGALAVVLRERRELPPASDGDASDADATADTTSDAAAAEDWRGTLAQLAGLVAIALAVAAFDRTTPYPGLAAVAPAFGAVALLVGGRMAPDGIVSRALGAGWLRWLGRLSYGWYLWHWPLIGLGAVLHRQIGVPGKLAWAAGALGLAWLTHRFVERPARERELVPAPWIPITALGASVAAALVAHGAMVAAERRAAAPDQRAFAAARTDRMIHPCWGTTVEAWPGRGRCTFGDTSAATTIVLLGDSHAEHWLGALDRLGRERGWKIVAMVKGGCPVAGMPEFGRARRPRFQEECAEFREAMLRRIVAMRPAAAILSSWDHYVPIDSGGGPSDWQVTPETWERGLRHTYRRLAAAGIPTVAIRGTPRTWFNVPSCLSRRAAGLPFSPPCEYERSASLSRIAYDAQTAAARGLPIAFVDMNDQICATARCGVVRNGVVVFTDDNHLTASFSRSVAPVFGARVRAAVARFGRMLP
jgi:peptidoglycan/LPS O-acetylase OafA/YrhL